VTVLSEWIEIKGAKANNLKNIDVKIPKGKITAVVGISGAGKSSLAFQTLYAEGYIRYIESISPYIRQFLDKVEKPPVERIDGLPPAIAFRQKKPAKNPRSIVATSTDIYDYFRLVYAKIADFYCPNCSIRVSAYTADEIMSKLLHDMEGETIDICFPYRGDVAFLINRGYYFHIDEKTGEKKRIDSDVKGRSVYVLLDRLTVKEDNKSRIFEAVDKSIAYGEETAVIFFKRKKIEFPSHLFCPSCKTHYPMPDENLFSFNSPRGACPACRGFGDIQELNPDLIFDRSHSLANGAMIPFRTITNEDFRDYVIRNAEKKGIDSHQPLEDLNDDELHYIMYGDSHFVGVKGFFDYIKKKRYKVQARVLLSRYTSYSKCEVCGGSRLNNTALSFKVRGVNLAQLLSFTIEEAFHFFREIDWAGYKDKISADVFEDINFRLNYLVESGLSYIHLNRLTFTLSRGELQRINLAFILGSTLSDSLLILDQPSCDLHPNDYLKLTQFIKNLKENGNTVLMVEHNRDIIEHADHVIELGPLSGKEGGKKVFWGGKEKFFDPSAADTLSQKFLHTPLFIKRGEKHFNRWFTFKNASTHNLKHFDWRIPANAFTVICGVSGAGKTTLLYHETFLKAPKLAGIKDIIFIDPGLNRLRANTTVAGFFDIYPTIREVFARQTESRRLGYVSGHFSFNSPRGRCEKCKGNGFLEIEMQFLPSVKIQCDECNGKGFKPEILRVKYKGLDISRFLDLNIDESIKQLEEDHPPTQKILTNIKENGLGYLRLGQRLNTLSAGELQRLKLVKYLNIRKSSTLFLIDEPSFGLHPYDIEMIKTLISRIIKHGNTVAAAEHNLDLIANADYIIELGPAGGEKGGYLLVQGSTEALMVSKVSTTGNYLKKNLKRA
jgi:excinuclease ABC subunit A